MPFEAYVTYAILFVVLCVVLWPIIGKALPSSGAPLRVGRYSSHRVGKNLVGQFATPEAADHDKRVTQPLRAAFNAQSCPDCRGDLAKFYAGPEGGMSINLCCSSCFSAFNVAFFNG